MRARSLFRCPLTHLGDHVQGDAHNIVDKDAGGRDYIADPSTYSNNQIASGREVGLVGTTRQ